MKKRWLRKDLLTSSFLTGISGYLIPVSISFVHGYAALGIWLAFRSILQVILVLIPNPATLLLQTTVKTGEEAVLEEKRLESSIFTFSLMFSTLILLSIIIIIKQINLSDFEFIKPYLALYAFFFINSSIFSIVARVKKQSSLILTASYFDTFFIVLAVVLNFISFDFLLIIHIIKEIFRAFFFIKLVEIKITFLKVRDLFLQKRSGQYFRNILQVFSQYGDKAIMPFIFGFTVSGQIGLGNSVASAISILTSSAYMWSLPLILNDDKKAELWLRNEWFKVIAISVAGSWSLFLVSLIYLTSKEATFITIGFVTTTTISASFLYLTSSKEKANESTAIFLYGIITTIYFLLIYLTSFYTKNPETSITFGLLFFIFSMFLLTTKISKKISFIYVVLALNTLAILYISTII